ncbi:transmembrane protein 161A isoform X2 [Hypanus sabinus]|uniref:transmembrane protein 161A isoform X2 n=1 Tax=Hypanus sabinus TaxID=79690 RepID=UPI0028C3D35A|nr:transmembrane protein 161A isoform X2 [Hypanus sabinus]
MGVIGVQLVVSLLMASLMQRLVPHYSIGRWLLCNGSLFRFKHPSDDELRALAGKQKPRLRRDRRQNGVTENKPEMVPKDIKLSLEATPIKPLDALGFSNLYENLQMFFRQLGLGDIWPYSVARLIFKLSLVGVSSFIGACLTFPGLRLAQTHLDALRMTADKPLTQVLLYANFLSPILVLLLWVKPISRDFVISAPFGKEEVQLLSDSMYNTMRLWIILGLCTLRLLLTRYHLQAYLNLAERWVELMRREAGCISMIEIQRKISRVFCYLCVVTVQYLGPTILLLHSTLLLKVLGDYSWGWYPEPPGVSPAIDASPRNSGSAPGEEDDYRMAVSQITAALGALRNVFTPLFYRGLFSYLTWWLAACQVVTNLFGLYFHQYLMGS